MLSKEQQGLIENSQWVVNTVLKKHGVSYDNDLRQSALLYLCKCVMRYDPTKGVKWETYAYANIKLYIKRVIKKQNSYQSSCSELKQGAAVNGVEFSEPIYASVQIEALGRLCNPRERKVLLLLKDGHSCREISKTINRSPSTVSTIVKTIKLKAQQIL